MSLIFGGIKEGSQREMCTMDGLIEYTGHLIGGPDDGNYVSATTEKIPATFITKLWLDGYGENKVPIIVEEEGFYVWDDTTKYFRWQAEGDKVIKG